MSIDKHSVWPKVGSPDLGRVADGAHLYCLIDAAQVPGFSSLLLGPARAPVPGEPLAPEKFSATPHLVQLVQRQQLEQIISAMARTNSAPGALSILVAHRALPAMALALRTRMDVTLPDGMDCVNRFFDGRVAPHFVAILTADQRQRFCSFASQWWVLGHDLCWVSLTTTDDEPDPFAGPLVLDEPQQGQLIDACYPYAVIEHFERTDPELLERVPPERRYAVFDAALREASTYGVGEGADGIFFCTLVLTRGERFYQSPAWQHALMQVQRKQIRLRDAAKDIDG